MHQQIKQVVEIPIEEYQSMRELQEKILAALQSMKITAPTEYVTTQEFMTETKMSRWKFEALRDLGKLKVIQRGRKLYVPRTEIQRYFAGEMEAHK